MAAHALALELGTGPSSTAAVVQHLMNLQSAGKLKYEDVQAAEQYLNECPEDFDVVETIAAIKPLIHKIEGKVALQEAVLESGKGAPAQELADKFQKVADIGQRKATLGAGMPSSMDDLDRVLSPAIGEMLDTGVEDLDLELGRGLEKGALGVVVATTGSGKSIFLCHLSVHAMIHGYNVAYMSLELSDDEIYRRVLANLCDMTIEEMTVKKAEVQRRIQLWRNEGIGEIHVIKESPKVTTVGHLSRWLSDLKKEKGFDTDVIVVDYADKLVSKVGTNKSSYEDCGIVYEQIRDLAEEYDGWSWTASQAKVGATGRKRVGTDMAADSLNKMRVCDLAIGLARTQEDEENGQVRFSVPKRRTGEAHQTVGPVDWDAAHGRICFVHGRMNPWEQQAPKGGPYR